MKRSTKAALLSALVFPGAGHFYLKRHIVGIVLTGAALASISLIVSEAIDRAMRIAGEIQLGEGAVDVAAITELLSNQASDAGPLMDIATAVLIGAWFIGIVDAYRLGRAECKSAGEGAR